MRVKGEDWEFKGSPAKVSLSTFYGAETTKVYAIQAKPGTVELAALRKVAPDYEFCRTEWVTQTFCVVVPDVLRQWHKTVYAMRKGAA